MTNLSYNLSPKLNTYLEKIETLRKQILLSPVNPRSEVKLRWDASVNRVFWSINLSGNPVGKPETVKILSQLGLRKLGKDQKEILNYKKALDFITENYLVSNTEIGFNTIKKIYETCFSGIATKKGSLKAVQKEIDQILKYIQAGKDHPVIQAGIAQIEMINLTSKTDGNGCLARLIPYLFLYKHGYDFRGMLVIDEFLRRDVVTLRSVIENVAKTKNITLWLEYFAFGIATQLAKAVENIQKQKISTEVSSSFWKLNERQKEVLRMMEQPGVRITNKNVQKMFGISQITASRDLTQMTSLGLVFSHGKGRSVYYTRV